MKNCNSMRKAYEANFKSDGEPAGAMAAAWQKALGISASEEARKAKPVLSKAAMKHFSRKDRTELEESKAKLKAQAKKDEAKPDNRLSRDPAASNAIKIAHLVSLLRPNRTGELESSASGSLTPAKRCGGKPSDEEGRKAHGMSSHLRQGRTRLVDLGVEKLTVDQLSHSRTVSEESKAPRGMMARFLQKNSELNKVTWPDETMKTGVVARVRDAEVQGSGSDAMKSLTSAERYRVELEEFERLVEDMKPLGFTSSSELSAYIRNNHLGFNYPNIAGCLKMGLNGNEWDMDGGIDKRWYGMLCRRLNLTNQCSGARVLDFTSYGQMRRL